MKNVKALSFLSGAIPFGIASLHALMLAASPMIPAFTNAAFAGNGGMGDRGMKFEELNLTDAQKEQMKQIRESTRQQMDAILTDEQKAQLSAARQQRQKPNLNLSEDQKAKIKAIRENAKSQMEALLTAEQKQKLEELRASWRQRRQQQPSN